mmetsp:Transcript_36202/g.59234  ORF Transcript_36202/g.59234 Transcript_36202/m.59234 type:complete len:117 (-) Transcript_36202:325-675(-)
MLVSKLATSALARSALKKVVNPARHFSSLQVPGLNLGHEEDYVVFPKEREGLEYALNWSLADDGLTAAGEAFGNIKMASLKKKTWVEICRDRAGGFCGLWECQISGSRYISELRGV